MGDLDAAVRAALTSPDRGAATVTRAYLTGWAAALADLPGESPGVADLARAIESLLPRRRAISDGTGKKAVTVVEPAKASDDRFTADLRSLVEQVASRSAGPGDDAARLWSTLHLHALQLAKREADLLLRQAADIAARHGLRAADPTAVNTVAGENAEVLIPALRMPGGAAAPGLAVGPKGKNRGRALVPAHLATLAGLLPKLTGLDPNLHHCLQAIEFDTFRPLADPEQRTLFLDQLDARLAAFDATTARDRKWLDNVARLHEAVCSVVHLPPAPDDSWWGEWRNLCADALSDAAHESGAGTVKFPPARYQAADALTRHNIPVRFPQRSGQVLACVKAWTRIGDVENPGRVIYAS